MYSLSHKNITILFTAKKFRKKHTTILLFQFDFGDVTMDYDYHFAMLDYWKKRKVIHDHLNYQFKLFKNSFV